MSLTSIPCAVDVVRDSMCENSQSSTSSYLSVRLKDTMTLHSCYWPVLRPFLVQVCLHDSLFSWIGIVCVGNHLGRREKRTQSFCSS